MPNLTRPLVLRVLDAIRRGILSPICAECVTLLSETFELGVPDRRGIAGRNIRAPARVSLCAADAIGGKCWPHSPAPAAALRALSVRNDSAGATQNPDDAFPALSPTARVMALAFSPAGCGSARTIGGYVGPSAKPRARILSCQDVEEAHEQTVKQRCRPRRGQD